MRPLRMGFLQQNAVGTVDQAMAAMLLSKFSIIRLTGLAGKVLVIDEIHAYDMYMSQIIETLLKWCRALSVPVILLSATLQNAQKKRYLQAYSVPDIGSALVEQYPLITQVLPDQTVKCIEADAAQHYYYWMKPVPLPEENEQLCR